MKKKAKNVALNHKDWISQLPDETLANILSRLVMKEAARTCVLSRRWRSLWKLWSGCLDFDASDTMWLIVYGKKQLDTEAQRYRDWVDQVLDSHDGITLEGLRIAFELGESYATSLNKWLCLAIVKRVQRLELDLSSVYGSFQCCNSAFIFPSWLLHIKFLNFSSFDRLTSLCLKSVSITENDLAYFLSTCPLLERLSLENASSLQNFRVNAGQSLKLNHLDIRYCSKLENIEVSGTNLVSFKYAGPVINVNVPEFASISLVVEYYEMFFVKFHTSIMYLSRIEQLELDLRMMELSTCVRFPKHFPELSNLKQLELRFTAIAKRSILFLGSMIRASPRLRKLRLKYRVDWGRLFDCRMLPGILGSQEERLWEECERDWKEQAWDDDIHPCLNVIEFIGWAGVEKTDVELANYLIKSAISLEKIIVDPRIPCFIGRLFIREPDQYDWTREDAVSSAVKLERKLPPTVKLIIL